LLRCLRSVLKLNGLLGSGFKHFLVVRLWNSDDEG
jgi:hypothetical protein